MPGSSANGLDADRSGDGEPPTRTFPFDRHPRCRHASGDDPRRRVRRAGGLFRLHLRLGVADNFIRAGQAGSALVIGAETFSRILDWSDRTTCVLFGDGAGAVVLRSCGGDDPRRILSTHLHSDGRHSELLYVDGGPSSTGTVGHLRMEGREVFRHAVTNLSAVVEEALEANGLGPGDISWIVPHQANRRILDATARRLGLGMDRVIVTVDRHANTSAASVPLALEAGVSDGRISPGDLLLFEAMGGGFTWGAALARW